MAENEKYFSGEIGIWNDNECIDAYIVIFENRCDIYGRHSNYEILSCFINKINETYGEYWEIDWDGDSVAFANIILKGGEE